MSDYTPTTEQVRETYAALCKTDAAADEFDRWLAEHDRQVEARGIRKAADAWHAENAGTSPRAYRWMWDYAQKVKQA